MKKQNSGCRFLSLEQLSAIARGSKQELTHAQHPRLFVVPMSTITKAIKDIESLISPIKRASSGRSRIAALEDDRKIICASAQDPRRASSDIMAEISPTATSLPSRGSINRRLWVAGMYGGSLVGRYLDL